MKYILPLSLLFVLISCSNKKVKLNYDTSITSVIYQSRLDYLNGKLAKFARLSDTGVYYNIQSNILDERCSQLEYKIENGQKVTMEEQREFINLFEKALNNYQFKDTLAIQNLKEMNIETISDIEFIKIYYKENFVDLLLNSKFFIADAWGTQFSSPNWTIKNGQNFNVDMAVTANNAEQPFEWFLVKPKNGGHKGLRKEDIIDTVFSKSEFPWNASYSTKKYKMGENSLDFLVKIKQPSGDWYLEKRVDFTVK